PPSDGPVHLKSFRPRRSSDLENPQIIYVRVVDSQENEEAEGCVAFTTLTLRVEANPEPVTPDPIEICHLSGSDEATIVDLTIREDRKNTRLNSSHVSISYDAY